MKKEIAKKTIEKIEKEQAKLDGLLAKREEINAGFQEKLAEVNESIRGQEKVISSLREREKTEKLAAVASMFNKSGVSVDDLLNAVENNDLYGLQEMLENKGAKPAPESCEETPADNDTALEDDDDDFVLDNTENTY